MAQVPALSPTDDKTGDVQPGPSASPGPAVELIGVDKWYGQFHVLKNIDLTVKRGEKIVICGPSGSGKSTLIR